MGTAIKGTLMIAEGDSQYKTRVSLHSVEIV